MRLSPTIALAVLLVVFMGSGAFPDVIGYWRFEDGSGQYAMDEMGAYQGELDGSWGSLDPGGGDTSGKGWSTNVFADTIPKTGAANSGSLRFAGSSHFVDFSNGTDMYLGTNFTIEFFMKPDMPVIGSPICGLSPGNKLFMMLAVSGGNLYWRPQFQDHLEFEPADLVTIDQWQHVALVKQPGGYSIYVNGILDYNGSLPAGTDGPYYFPGTGNTGDRVIGGNSGSFRGWLDEFRISDEALTPDQFLNAVPEPGTLGLLSLGGLALLFSNPWKKRRKNFR